MTTLTIRAETPGDYDAIGAVHAETFDYSMSMGESLLVAALRGRCGYDAELSLVAEREGRVVGHVLLTPVDVAVREQIVRAVILAPLAVVPAAQGKGIGTALVREALARAAAKGYACSILLGHPEYYARFGFRPGMWSRRTIRIPYEAIPRLPEGAAFRRIRPEDADVLSAIWSDWHAGAELAVQPGKSFTDWISPASGMTACAVDLNGRTAGYCRFRRDRREIAAIAAADREALRVLCALLSDALVLQPAESLTVPSTPRLLDYMNGQVSEDIYTGPEQMLAVLDERCEALRSYCEDVTAGRVVPGRMDWPVEFDVF